MHQTELLSFSDSRHVTFNGELSMNVTITSLSGLHNWRRSLRHDCMACMCKQRYFLGNSSVAGGGIYRLVSLGHYAAPWRYNRRLSLSLRGRESAEACRCNTWRPTATISCTSRQIMAADFETDFRGMHSQIYLWPCDLQHQSFRSQVTATTPLEYDCWKIDACTSCRLFR